MSEKAKQKHIEVLVSYFLDGAQLMALRYYTENRVSRTTFNDARAKAISIKKFLDNKQQDI
jgi:hypothetical protein